MKKFFKNNKGFTLIELLVVIAILAVLATLYVPRIINSATDAKKVVEFANARTLASEITLYNVQHPDAKISGSATSGSGGTIPAAVASKFTAANGYEYIAEGDLTASHLIDGRDFPSTYAFLILDSDGNCFVVGADGEAYDGSVQ